MCVRLCVCVGGGGGDGRVRKLKLVLTRPVGETDRRIMFPLNWKICSNVNVIACDCSGLFLSFFLYDVQWPYKRSSCFKAASLGADLKGDL